MNYLNIIIFLVAGLIVGSFLNVIIFRLDDLKSVVTDRSRCRNCKTVISWYDLFPVLSYTLLRGKCRRCGATISWQYPVVELGTGLLYAGLYIVYGLTPALFFYLLVFSLLMIVAFYDILTEYVPEFFVWTSLILVALGGAYFGHFSFAEALIGAAIGGGLLFLLVLFSKEKWMGSGDIKIGLILGFLAGYPRVIFGLFSAFIIGSIAGIIYIYITKKGLKASLPFAPFLIFAALIAIIYGDKVINWYLGKLIF